MVSEVSGQLGGVPGAEELLGLAGRVDTADPGAVAGLGRRFGTAADGLAGSVRAVHRTGVGVGDAWQGAGADAFARYAEDFARAGSGTETAARRVADELGRVSTTLQSLRDEISATVSRALDAASAARARAATALAGPGGVAPDPDAAVRAALEAPTAEARAAVTRAEAELAAAAGRLRGLGGTLVGFTRLPVPDAAVIAPRAGSAPGWSPRRGTGGASGAAGSAGSSTRALRSVTSDDTGSAPSTPEEDPVTGGDSGSGGAGDDSGSGGAGDDSGPGGAGEGDLVESPDAGQAPADPASADPASADPAPADPAPTAPAAPAPAPTTGGPSGQVGDWIRQATGILAAQGVPTDQMNPDDIATIIEHESGGDPDATNGWDSNAARGTPSQGLMQTIGPTFEAHKLAGHGDIKNPIDNIIAGVRYAISRYGSVSHVPGVEALARGDSYVGY